MRYKHLWFCIGFSIVLNACSSAPTKGPTDISDLTAESAMADQAKEVEKRQALLKKQGDLSPETQDQNQKKAARIAARAKELFASGSFKKTAIYLNRSIELDASLDEVYYRYGVTLYKLNLFAKSVAILNMLEGTDVNQTELNYYQALCNYKLHNDQPALMKFKHVEEADDEVLSPLAAMYAGLMEKSSQHFDDAKKHFDYVLEKSKDPAMDKRADSQIDDMLHQQQILDRAKQKWSYSVYAGTAYDSDVLNSAAVNAVLNDAAYRVLYGGAVSYKALYTQRDSLVPQLWATDMYSVDKDFKASSVVQSADPFQSELSLPYKHIFNAGTLTLIPSYQTLVMSLNGGNRDLVYDAIALATIYTISYADDWITNWRFDVDKERFYIKNIVAADDQSALKYSLLFSQTNLLNDEGNETLTMDLLYSYDNTEGDNFRNSKFLVGFGGNFPMSHSGHLAGYARGDYFLQNFPSNSAGRKDSGFIVTLGGGYTFTEKTTLGLNLQYYDNNSSASLYDYHKYVLTAIYSFNSGFF